VFKEVFNRVKISPHKGVSKGLLISLDNNLNFRRWPGELGQNATSEERADFIGDGRMAGFVREAIFFVAVLAQQFPPRRASAWASSES
jgi:hypothetical protein